MIRFCREHGVAHEIWGKVIVATSPAEVSRVHELKARGEQNGVTGLRVLSPEQLREREPHCRGIAALDVPGAGITDYGAVARKYAELAAAAGVEFLMNAEVRGIERASDCIVLETVIGAIRAKRVINCAGLYSDRLMRLAGDRQDFRLIPFRGPFRGEYYKVAPARHNLLRNLIYPVPDPRFPFLGVHFTRHVDGFIEAGPNAVLALSREGYRMWDVDARDVREILAFPGFWRMAAKHWKDGAGEVYRSLSKRAFTEALQRLVPEIEEDDLIRAGAGVRAQAVDRNGRLVDDFLIVPSDRIIHVCNVPSPAATASLVIGRQIVATLESSRL
jgi:L-2-hydroxyglutarate oxidase LhgO